MVEVLGKGSSGTVLRSKVGSGFEVAIKIVSKKNKRIQEELEREVNVLKKCRHPNIVTYYGTYLQGDEVWIIMDYCGAGSIKDVIQLSKKNLTENQTKYVLHPTIKGLLHLHLMKILHLDIKSANILLTDSGSVKLADFGVSTQLSTHTSFIAATNYVGSPLFMSPEVIRKDKYGSSSDIWSLGITTIEMVEGRPPNTDINCLEMLPMLLERDPPQLQKPDAFSTDFNNFIALCLKKVPEQRPSCVDLLQEPLLDPTKLPGSEVISELLQEAGLLVTMNRQKL
eukprot:TRINITY_DN4207_c1_g1_i11.p1 TRINITY_DN4207_c1_g1~~TRINITY_DN4207_c1_g1_i11.p1  ORF type:complete len:283 (-),score=52.78 TRINITY_DN4207_c1_g1_i11:53-901(-)